MSVLGPSLKRDGFERGSQYVGVDSLKKSRPPGLRPSIAAVPMKLLLSLEPKTKCNGKGLVQQGCFAWAVQWFPGVAGLPQVAVLQYLTPPYSTRNLPRSCAVFLFKRSLETGKVESVIGCGLRRELRV